MSSQRGKWAGGVPAQVVAPLEAKSVRVEFDQRRDHVVQGQDALGSRRGGRCPAIRPLDGLAAPTGPAPSCAPSRRSPALHRGRSHLHRDAIEAIPACRPIDRSRLQRPRLRKPVSAARVVWASQPVAAINSSMVAPRSRSSSATTRASFEPPRGADRPAGPGSIASSGRASLASRRGRRIAAWSRFASVSLFSPASLGSPASSTAIALAPAAVSLSA